MLGKLPECWIAPDHLLDLRTRVRLRHTLVDDRGDGSSGSGRCSTTTGSRTAQSSI